MSKRSVRVKRPIGSVNAAPPVPASPGSATTAPTSPHHPLYPRNSANHFEQVGDDKIVIPGEFTGRLFLGLGILFRILVISMKVDRALCHDLCSLPREKVQQIKLTVANSLCDDKSSTRLQPGSMVIFMLYYPYDYSAAHDQSVPAHTPARHTSAPATA